MSSFGGFGGGFGSSNDKNVMPNNNNAFGGGFGTSAGGAFGHNNNNTTSPFGGGGGGGGFASNNNNMAFSTTSNTSNTNPVSFSSGFGTPNNNNNNNPFGGGIPSSSSFANQSTTSSFFQNNNNNNRSTSFGFAPSQAPLPFGTANTTTTVFSAPAPTAWIQPSFPTTTTATTSSSPSSFSTNNPNTFGSSPNTFASATFQNNPFGGAPAASSSSSSQTISFGTSSSVMQFNNNNTDDTNMQDDSFNNNSNNSSFNNPFGGHNATTGGNFGTSFFSAPGGGANDNNKNNNSLNPFGTQSSALDDNFMADDDNNNKNNNNDDNNDVGMGSASSLPSFTSQTETEKTKESSGEGKVAELKAKLAEKRRKLQEAKRRKQQQQQQAQGFSPMTSRDSSPVPPSRANSPRLGSKSTTTVDSSQLPSDLKTTNISTIADLSTSTNLSADRQHLDLKDATSLVGTCLYMCPDDELLRRQQEQDIQLLERVHSQIHPTEWNLRNTVVKRFRRSAADYKLDVPEWVRPPKVLEQVCAYLEEWVMERDRQGPDPRYNQGTTNTTTIPPLDVYQFIWDRTRMVRKDFILQNYVGTGGKCSARAVRCHERIARWHILCEHQLSHMIEDYCVQQSPQNIAELGQTMKTLNQFYDDSLGRATIVEPSDNNDDNKTKKEKDVNVVTETQTEKERLEDRHGCTSNVVCGVDPVDFDGTELKNNNDNNPSTETSNNDSKRIIGNPNSPSNGTAEGEMRGLYILLTLDNEGGMEVLKYASKLSSERPHIFYSKPVQLAMSIFKAKHELNYARFFAILKAPSTPYLFACLMFKYVQEMRRVAFRIMSSTYGYRKKRDAPPIHDHYPIKYLVHLLCFEDADEARKACQHYNITVKTVSVPSSSSPTGSKQAELIFWKQSRFKEPQDPEKGHIIPLRPRKMIRTIERKLGKERRGTRLGICRGEYSILQHSKHQQDAVQNPVSSAVTTPPLNQDSMECNQSTIPISSSPVPPPDTQQSIKEEEEQQQEQQRKLEEEEKMKREEAIRRQQAEELARKVKERELQETERRRQEQIAKEHREAAERAERERQEAAERERQARKERERKAREAAEKERLAAQERERLAQEAAEKERRAQEVAAKERERQRQAQKEEEERRRLQAEKEARLEAERKALEEQRAAEEKKRQLERERVAREEERRRQERIREIEMARKRKAEQRRLEQERKRAEREKLVNDARKVLLWRRLKAKLGSNLQNLETAKSLGRIDPTFTSVAAPDWVVTQDYHQPQENQEGGVELNVCDFFQNLSNRTNQIPLESLLSRLLDHGSMFSNMATRPDDNDLEVTSNVFLIKLAVLIPRFDGALSHTLHELIHQWVGRRLQSGSVVHCTSRDVQVRFIAVNGDGGNRCHGSDIALLVIPPFVNGVEYTDGDIKTIMSNVNESVPVVALNLDNGSCHEFKAFVDRVIDTLCAESVVQPGGDDCADFEEALVVSVSCLFDCLNTKPTSISIVSISWLAFCCFREVLWSDATMANINDDTSKVRLLDRVKAVFDDIAPALEELESNFKSSPWCDWPAKEFVNRGLVKGYFGDGHRDDLPLLWSQSLSRQNVEPFVNGLREKLQGSFPLIIESMLESAPEALKKECCQLMVDCQFLRCLDVVMEFKCKKDKYTFRDRLLYLPNGMVLDVVDSCKKRLCSQDDEINNSSLVLREQFASGSKLLPFRSVKVTTREKESPKTTNNNLSLALVPTQRNTAKREMVLLDCADKVAKKRKREESEAVRTSKAFTARLEAILRGETTVDISIGGSRLSDIVSSLPPIQVPPNK